MSRVVSSGFRAALWAQESGEVLVCLLTITHDHLDEPLYLSTDATIELTADPKTYGTTSRGRHYTFVPLAVVLPDDVSEGSPNARLEIDNIDQSLIGLVRSISSPASVQLELVLASDPDTVEIDFPAMQLGSVQYDREVVSFELVVDALFAEPYPGNSFLPSDFPGLF